MANMPRMTSQDRSAPKDSVAGRAVGRLAKLEKGYPYGGTPGVVEGVSPGLGTPALPKVQKRQAQAKMTSDYADTGSMGHEEADQMSMTGKSAPFTAGSRGSR